VLTVLRCVLTVYSGVCFTQVTASRGKGQRMDAFLTEQLAPVSRAKIQGMIKLGQVSVNGVVETRARCETHTRASVDSWAFFRRSKVQCSAQCSQSLSKKPPSGYSFLNSRKPILADTRLRRWGLRSRDVRTR
jgi:hypothetical protein